MPKRTKSKSKSKSQSEDPSTSSESEQTIQNSSPISKYEEQRLQRIAENQAKLKAMGLPQMVSSLKKVTPINKKGKQKLEHDDDDDDDDDDDEEYTPQNEEEEQEPHSDSSSEHHELDSDFETASESRKRKAKNKSLKVKSRVTGKKHGGNLDYIDDEEEALLQAIALSLQDSAEASVCPNKNVGNIGKAEKKGNIQEDKGRKKNKKSFTSRLQMTEDELIVHFFQLDEAGKGTVTVRDLEKAAITHDFSWTDKELVDMIRCFDSDGDGRINLDDFRKIVVRCNMIKGSENS